jgi:predicted dehydrogenase
MLKFGFIGCGKISRFHADTLLALNHGIVGVSAREGSQNIEDFSKSYNVPNAYYDWQEMIEGEELDALVVAVGWEQTEHIVEKIINAGLPCLVEKPVALSSEKIEEIVHNTRPFHDRVMIGYNRRFYEFIPKIAQALQEKELISIELNFPEAMNRLVELKSENIVDHILTYMTSHWLDLLMSLIGDVKVGWMDRKMNEVSGHIEAYNGILKSVRFGVPIHLQANFNAPSNISMTFNFRDCIYKLCPIETSDNPIKRYIPKIQETFCVDTSFKPGFLGQMRHFIDTCVLKEKANTLGCTVQDALAVTKLCEAIKHEACLV